MQMLHAPFTGQFSTSAHMTSLLQLSNIWLCCPFRVVTLHSIRTTHATTASVPRDTRRPWCVAGSDSNQTIPAGKKDCVILYSSLLCVKSTWAWSWRSLRVPASVPTQSSTVQASSFKLSGEPHQSVNGKLVPRCRDRVT